MDTEAAEQGEQEGSYIPRFQRGGKKYFSAPPDSGVGDVERS